MMFLTGAVAVSIFFKPMLEEFGWNRAVLSSVQSVALIVFTIASPFIGRLIDRFGPRAMVLVSVATQVLSRVVNGVASNIWHLYLGRFLFGITALPPSQVLLNRWFVKKRGRALGLAATGMAIGMMALAPLSQYLILQWGWRQTMLFWAGVSLLVTLPLALRMKDSPEEMGYAPDGEPLENSSEAGRSPTQGDALRNMRPAQKGSSLVEVAKARSFWFLAGSHIICGIGCGFMMTHIVIFATDMGYTEMVGASLVSVQGGLNIAGVLFTGFLSDRVARKNVVRYGFFTWQWHCSALVGLPLPLWPPG
jgi:sugar phosphate permease